jgi:two-component system NtrC family sensor kinase
MNAQGVEYSDKLYKQAQRTHRIVQNLLSFARQHKPERIAVQLNQILEDTLALRDYDLRMSNIRIHFELAPDLPMIAADPHQLQQVFLNLVNNAVDAVLETSSEGDLWIRTEEKYACLSVEFQDSGPGVKDASRVFDPFYTTKPVGKGTGLGLSICYGIVTEHGGSIRVRNIEPRGACFSIELPYQRPAKNDDANMNLADSSRHASRILVLDPDPSILEAVGTALRERNHLVQGATTRAEAQSFLEQQEFDAIVADETLYESAGPDALYSWLEKNKPVLARHLLCMRASAIPGVAGADLKNGNGLRVLQKPFKAEDLLAAVESALGHVQTLPIKG